MTKQELLDLMHLEGDNLEFEYKGYQCQILRNKVLGHLCGYIKVDNQHWLYGKDYETINITYDIPSHGGLTYSGTDGTMWTIGFDCNHHNDNNIANYYMSEQAGIDLVSGAGTYKTMEYVKSTLEDMVTGIIRSY